MSTSEHDLSIDQQENLSHGLIPWLSIGVTIASVLSLALGFYWENRESDLKTEMMEIRRAISAFPQTTSTSTQFEYQLELAGDLQRIRSIPQITELLGDLQRAGSDMITVKSVDIDYLEKIITLDLSIIDTSTNDSTDATKNFDLFITAIQSLGYQITNKVVQTGNSATTLSLQLLRSIND